MRHKALADTDTTISQICGALEKVHHDIQTAINNTTGTNLEKILAAPKDDKEKMMALIDEYYEAQTQISATINRLRAYDYRTRILPEQKAAIKAIVSLEEV